MCLCGCLALLGLSLVLSWFLWFSCYYITKIRLVLRFIVTVHPSIFTVRTNFISIFAQIIGINMAICSAKTVQSIIKDRRKALKLSQTDLGKRLGMSRRSYQNCETGRMSTEQMQDICRELNLTIFILPSDHIM